MTTSFGIYLNITGFAPFFFKNPEFKSLPQKINGKFEDERCINVNSIESVYFYAPVGGTLGVYTGIYRLCDGTPEPSLYPFNNNEMFIPN